MDWDIPISIGEDSHLRIPLGTSDRLFIVGANGSGKSALIQHFVTSNQGASIRRLSAQRQNWFSSGSIDLTPKTRRDIATQSQNYDSRDDARWMDRNAEQRLSAVLFDLVADENARARSIAIHVDNNDTDKATEISTETRSTFIQLNELLTLGSLTVALENSEDEEILARHRGGQDFSLAKLSDGERNAIIIAATVLTIEPGTVLLIDEPERHLHRSIIKPFLSALFECRTDCPFVISTHEIALPAANPDARVLMLRSCTWNGDAPNAWDIQMLERNSPLPEELNLAILGSRSRILFVEGTLSSLDQPLYNVLFPDVTVISRGGCSNVQKAVAGLREAIQYHRVEAFGLVDRDDRTTNNVDELAQDGVFALDVHSAEAIYYGSIALTAVAQRQAESLDLDADKLVRTAIETAIASLKKDGVAERMAARRRERVLRDLVVSQIPGWKSILESAAAEINLSVASPYDVELKRFRELVDAAQWDQLVARYPLRESPAFGLVAKSLQCVSNNIYEQTLLSRLHADDDLVARLRIMVGPLSQALEAEPGPQVLATA